MQILDYDKSKGWHYRPVKERTMEFDKSRVYTALNADELRAGDKVIVGNSMAELQKGIANKKQDVIKQILSEDAEARFVTKDGVDYSLAYLVKKVSYRPFKNFEELNKTWAERVVFDHEERFFTLPCIWVQRNCTTEKSLIVTFTKDSVYLGHRAVTLKELFDDFTFLDGSICGVEE